MSAASASSERVRRAVSSNCSSTVVLILTRAIPRLYHICGTNVASWAVAARQTHSAAAVLGVNTNAVLRALRQLRDEGLLEFRRGGGITARLSLTSLMVLAMIAPSYDACHASSEPRDRRRPRSPEA